VPENVPTSRFQAPDFAAGRRDDLLCLQGHVDEVHALELRAPNLRACMPIQRQNGALDADYESFDWWSFRLRFNGNDWSSGE
jgi:hypothetical protein